MAEQASVMKHIIKFRGHEIAAAESDRLARNIADWLVRFCSYGELEIFNGNDRVAIARRVLRSGMMRVTSEIVEVS